MSIIKKITLLNLFLFLSIVGFSQVIVVDTIVVGNYPRGIGVNPQTNRIYVANSGSDNVSIINGSGDSVVTTIGVGNEPWGVGVNPQTNRIYVSCPYDGTIWVLLDLTGGVEDSSHNSRVLSFTVYPNPFSNRIEFNFYLVDGNRKGDVNFSIYNVGGRLVKSFSLGSKHSSTITISWDGRDNSGKKLSSGVYFGVLKAGDNKFSKRKMIMIK
jgi:YVTN family beta-propeller protein